MTNVHFDTLFIKSDSQKGVVYNDMGCRLDGWQRLLSATHFNSVVVVVNGQFSKKRS